MEIVYFISWGTIAVVAVLVMLFGISLAEKIVPIVIGPVKWLLIICTIAISCMIAYHYFSDTEKSKPTRLFSAVVNGFCCLCRTSLTSVFILCILYGFLVNMDGHLIWGFFAMIGDLIVAGLAGSLSIMIDTFPGSLIDDYSWPTILVTIIIAFVSAFYIILLQSMMCKYYGPAIPLIFKNQTIIDFLSNSWLLRIAEHL